MSFRLGWTIQVSLQWDRQTRGLEVTCLSQGAWDPTLPSF
ncbi:hypothetical protein LEMLEM_LOCUS19341 [Lemmus lemmus]